MRCKNVSHTKNIGTNLQTWKINTTQKRNEGASTRRTRNIALRYWGRKFDFLFLKHFLFFEGWGFNDLLEIDFQEGEESNYNMSR